MFPFSLWLSSESLTLSSAGYPELPKLWSPRTFCIKVSSKQEGTFFLVFFFFKILKRKWGPSLPTPLSVLPQPLCQSKACKGHLGSCHSDWNVASGGSVILKVPNSEFVSPRGIFFSLFKTFLAVLLKHTGISPTKDGTSVSAWWNTCMEAWCPSHWSTSHWTTGEFPTRGIFFHILTPVTFLKIRGWKHTV